MSCQCPALSDRFSSLVSVARAVSCVLILILTDTRLLRSHLLTEALAGGLMWVEGRGEEEPGHWAAVPWFWVVPVGPGLDRACGKHSTGSGAAWVLHGCCTGAELPHGSSGEFLQEPCHRPSVQRDGLSVSCGIRPQDALLGLSQAG